jgi:hypothetical protein
MPRPSCIDATPIRPAPSASRVTAGVAAAQEIVDVDADHRRAGRDQEPAPGLRMETERLQVPLQADDAGEPQPGAVAPQDGERRTPGRRRQRRECPAAARMGHHVERLTRQPLGRRAGRTLRVEVERAGMLALAGEAPVR